MSRSRHVRVHVQSGFESKEHTQAACAYRFQSGKKRGSACRGRCRYGGSRTHGGSRQPHTAPQARAAHCVDAFASRQRLYITAGPLIGRVFVCSCTHPRVRVAAYARAALRVQVYARTPVWLCMSTAASLCTRARVTHAHTHAPKTHQDTALHSHKRLI